MARRARDLHPGAWWIWALGLAVGASVTTNPMLLLLEIGVAGLVVALRRGDHPWSSAFRLYLVLGVVIVVVRVVFRIVLGDGYDASPVLVRLPQIPLPHWVMGITLLGPVHRDAVLSGTYAGLQLATLVICVGAANALANPKRLLKSVPPALYEIGTALVIAISVLPQLAESLQRVRAARALRAAGTSRLGGLRRIVVPVLEDALERSLALAAGMDTRGYGRAGELGRGRRHTTGALMVGGLIGLCVGTYALLDQTTPRVLSTPVLVLGVVLAVGGLWSAGARVERTRYRPDRWRPAELAVAASGVLVAVGLLLLVAQATRNPDLGTKPGVSLGALLVVLVGLVPVIASPPPARADEAPTRSSADSVHEAVAA